MDTHTKNNPLNPINYKETKEDRQHAKDELMRDTLQELSIKYLGEDATDFYNDIEDLGSKDSHQIWEDLNDNGFFHVDITYYYKAMEYLKEHDPSLSESLELAAEYGYETQNLNSETLASLHASRDRENKFYEFVAPELEKITK